MNDAIYAAIGAVVFLLLLIALSYNRFVGQRNLIRDSWANIDTELRRRYDLIPNLVHTVKGYAAHERELFERVTATRAHAQAATGAVDEQARAEAPLVQALRGLLAVVENYPALRANEHFQALQEELAITEDRLATTRRFFNANVRDYNRRVQSVPSNLIAAVFGFKAEKFFEVEEAIRGPREVNVTPS